MRILDPESNFIDKVINPIYEYLRGRSDTTRCVILLFIGEDKSELMADLKEESGIKYFFASF